MNRILKKRCRKPIYEPTTPPIHDSPEARLAFRHPQKRRAGVCNELAVATLSWMQAGKNKHYLLCQSHLDSQTAHLDKLGITYKVEKI